MLIYRGWGFLVILLPIVFAMIEISLNGQHNGNGTLQGFLYSLLCSGVTLFLLGRWMNRKGQHDAFFIKVEYWGVAYAVVAVGLLVFKGF